MKITASITFLEWFVCYGMVVLFSKKRHSFRKDCIIKEKKTVALLRK